MAVMMALAEYYTDACRRLFELRMSLLPYLYSAFVEYHQKGIPPIRPLCMEYPHDLQVRNIDDEYFFGKDMVVCPLTAAQKGEREGYLPGGTWYDLFSGEEIAGGRQFHISADVEKIPVYVRDGAVVPFAEPVQCVREDTVFRMHVKHFGKKAGSFVLYEDDFVTYDHEKKGFGRIRISVDDVTVEFYMERPYSIWPYTMAITGIVPEHAYGSDYGLHPIGSGRYVLKQWDRGQQIILEANPDYYGEGGMESFVQCDRL